MGQPEHFDELAAGIASLPEGDPELLEARLHAVSCERCAKALREAEQLMALLDASPPLETPSPAVLERSARAVLAQMDAPAKAAWILPAAAVAVAWSLLVLLAHQRADEMQNWMISGGVLAGALVLTALALRAGAASLAVSVGASVALAFTGGGAEGLFLSHGVKCTLTELAAAALPFAALAWVMARRRTEVTALNCSAVAAAGALGGQAALEVTCPELAHTPHLFATHVAGVVLAALLGMLGHPLVARRAEA